MICIKKIANRQKGEDNFKTSLRTFDPVGLSGTTTPLSGSPYGNSQEVSVTSPLNNGFYFEIVEELSFLGSNEIIS